MAAQGVREMRISDQILDVIYVALLIGTGLSLLMVSGLLLASLLMWISGGLSL